MLYNLSRHHFAAELSPLLSVHGQTLFSFSKSGKTTEGGRHLFVVLTLGKYE